MVESVGENVVVLFNRLVADFLRFFSFVVMDLAFPFFFFWSPKSLFPESEAHTGHMTETLLLIGLMCVLGSADVSDCCCCFLWGCRSSPSLRATLQTNAGL